MDAGWSKSLLPEQASTMSDWSNFLVFKSLHSLFLDIFTDLVTALGSVVLKAEITNIYKRTLEPLFDHSSVRNKS